MQKNALFVDIPENRWKKEATIATNDRLINDQSLFENCLMEMEECFNPSVGEWFKCLDIIRLCQWTVLLTFGLCPSEELPGPIDKY